MPSGHGDVRIYRKHLFGRVFLAVLLPFIMLSLLVMIGVIFLGNHEPLSAGKIAGAIVLVVIALALLGLLIFNLTYEVTLTDAAIAVSYLGSHRMLANTEIAGRRDVRGRSRWLTIVPTDLRAKPLRLASDLATDAYFESRIAGLRDLIAEDRKASETEIAGNPRYGATPEERLARLARARTVMNWLNTAAGLVALWVIFAPSPYLAAIGAAAIFPLLAIMVVAASGGLVRFARTQIVVNPTAGAIPFLCVIALVLRSHADIHLVDWGLALKLGGIGGLALFALAVMVDRSLARRIGVFVTAALVAIAYSVSVLILADTSFDHSAGQDFRSQILDSHISRSKSVRYFLKLAPWGPQQGAEEVSVSHATFDRLMPGASVCPRLHDGAVGIRWFTVSFCAPDASIPFE
jgi:hypothetical protein